MPKDSPIHNAPDDRALRAAIKSKIDQTHVVVIPTGMYTAYSKWIDIEIEISEDLKKRILGVNPWGQLRKGSRVQGAAHRLVGWRQQSVMDGIWWEYKASQS